MVWNKGYFKESKVKERINLFISSKSNLYFTKLLLNLGYILNLKINFMNNITITKENFFKKMEFLYKKIQKENELNIYFNQTKNSLLSWKRRLENKKIDIEIEQFSKEEIQDLMKSKSIKKNMVEIENLLSKI